MSEFKKYVGKHPVAIFCLLAYAITWSVWAPISYGYVSGSLELTPLVVTIYMLGSFGPLLSAAIVTALTGGSLRAWFVQALRWRVSVKWWLAAFFVPIILYGIMAAIHMLMGGTFNIAKVTPLLALPGGFLSVFLWGGGNEELGWRGFALPRLQERYAPFWASLMIGVVWTLWHAPPGIIELGLIPWALDLPFYMVAVTGISMVATWLYNRTGGSVLLTMVFHASVNVTQSLYPVEGMFTRTGEFARVIAWVVLVIGIVLLPQSGFFRTKRAGNLHQSDITVRPIKEV